MTSSFKVKYGQTFDVLFEEGEGTQTFGIIDSDGVDVGQKYLPADSGDPAAECGFLDSTGEDIGPKLCLIGTSMAGVTFKTYMDRYYPPDWDNADTSPGYPRIFLEISGWKGSKELTVSGTVYLTYSYTVSSGDHYEQTYHVNNKANSFSAQTISNGKYCIMCYSNSEIWPTKPLGGWHGHMTPSSTVNSWTLTLTCGKFSVTTPPNEGIF